MVVMFLMAIRVIEETGTKMTMGKEVEEETLEVKEANKVKAMANNNKEEEDRVVQSHGEINRIITPGSLVVEDKTTNPKTQEQGINLVITIEVIRGTPEIREIGEVTSLTHKTPITRSGKDADSKRTAITLKHAGSGMTGTPDLRADSLNNSYVSKKSSARKCSAILFIQVT